MGNVDLHLGTKGGACARCAGVARTTRTQPSLEPLGFHRRGENTRQSSSPKKVRASHSAGLPKHAKANTIRDSSSPGCNATSYVGGLLLFNRGAPIGNLGTSMSVVKT